ncbi:heme peroxidase, partial [Saccharata proteae CBS 121410]
LTHRLEHLLVDTDGAYRSGLKDAITPCSNYVNGPQTMGRQTSAQWVRVAFHDFITARVAEGTGGLDASIGFETWRDENVGTAFNDTFGFLAEFVDEVTSMADLLALSVVLSYANCGYLLLPFAGGRIDATEAGPPGVPQPQSSLDDTLQFFANAGFNGSEAIALTACGHGIGHVHHSGFPNVVPESAVTPDNTQGGINLDSTPHYSDNNVVLEYLGGYGQCGGPLVTSSNVTVRSDLRLYESDGNYTMQYLGSDFQKFANVCGDVLERMINTVPKDVTLTDPINVQNVKLVNATFDTEYGEYFSPTKRFYGSFLQNQGPYTLTISAPNGYTNTTTLTTPAGTGSSIFGTSTWYPFAFDIPPGSGPPTTLCIDNATGATIHTQTLQSRLFFVPRQSGTITDPTSNRILYTMISAALLKTSAVSADAAVLEATVHVPTPQQGTLAPKIVAYTVPMAFAAEAGDYWIYN